MRAKLIILPFVFLLLTFSVSAIKVYNAECHDDGSFEITLRADSDKYAYTKEMTVSADGKRVKGSWDNDKIRMTDSAYAKTAIFTGRENQLLEKKIYNMKILYKLRTETSEEDAELNFEMECPGLLFTCNKLGIKINDCTTSKTGRFTANLNIYGLEQSPQGTMDPLKVINYILDTQILYKDINGVTSKRGSLPQGTIITKVEENKYFIEANFDKYTTNHVEKMWVNFNDNLIRPCSPADYSSVILSHNKECEYKETEEDILTRLKEEEEEQKEDEPEPYDVNQEIQDLETQKYQIEQRLNELYTQRGEPSTEETSTGGIQEEPKNTGYSTIKEPDSVTKKKSQLKILLTLLLGVVVIGGSLLAYLYKQGYFY